MTNVGENQKTFAIEQGRCIRCGACALLAPSVFEMTANASRVYGEAGDAETLRAAEAAVLICPTMAIRARRTAASVSPSPGPTTREPSGRAPVFPLFPHFARHSESVRWRLGTIDWPRVDPARASVALRTLVREMAFSEHATYSATQRFMQTFGDDVDFTQWISIWFYEETRHPHVLMEWLRAVGEPVDSEFVLRGRVSTPFMKSKMGTLVTNIVSEVTAASAYGAMGAGAVEPVLGQLGTFIAGDEARHAGSFFRFAHRRVQTASDPDRERLDALKVLHFWLNETDQVSHPINQMLERLGAGQDANNVLGAVTFDLAAVKRRVTRLIGLLVDIPLVSPEHVLPVLKAMTTARHERQREVVGEAPYSSDAGDCDMASPRDTHWDAIVVGAGLGGLSAAAALTRSGYRTLVLEQHDVPGGYAHRFLRRPRGTKVTFAFDVALHQIGGLAPDRILAKQLTELGVMSRIRLRRFGEVCRTTGPAHDFVVSADVSVYAQQLVRLFPDHRAQIDDLFHRLAAADLGVCGYDDPPAAARDLMRRTARDVIREHVADDRFVAIFSVLWAYLGLPPTALCAFTFAQVWASYHVGGCYYIEGGGQALSNAFVDVVESGGGQVVLNAAVREIVHAGGRAVGVATDRHGEFRSDLVVSNASVSDTFGRLHGNGNGNGDTDARDAANAQVSTSIVETYVGLRGRAEDLGLSDRLLFCAPSYDCDAQWAALQSGDHSGVPLVFANHNLSDPGNVPDGRSILNAAVLANGAPWMALDDRAYAEQKKFAEQYLLGRLGQWIPDLADRIEVCETGTPRTMNRYSWNPDGAIYGVSPTARTHPLRRPRPRTRVPGLYLAGAWTFPAGGFHGAIVSGLHTARLAAADLAGQSDGNTLMSMSPPVGLDGRE
jgi:all-trans-retinol 13,14-reductase